MTYHFPWSGIRTHQYANRITQLSYQDIYYACEWRTLNLLAMHRLSEISFINHIFCSIAISNNQPINFTNPDDGQCFKNDNLAKYMWNFEDWIGYQYLQLLREFQNWIGIKISYWCISRT